MASALLRYRCATPAGYRDLMDGSLHRVSEHTWTGTLHGYQVQVFQCGGSWHFHVTNPKGYTEACWPAASLADAARKARAWVEAHPLED